MSARFKQWTSSSRSDRRSYARTNKRTKAEIKRNYFIIKKDSSLKEKKKYDNFSGSKDWPIENDVFTIFFNKGEISVGNNEKEEKKNLDKLLLQLTSVDAIREYKERFKKIDI